MLEYGNGIGQVSGGGGGGSPVGGGGQNIDVGASAAQFVNDSVTTLSTMPPAALLAAVALLFLGLLILRKAF